MMNATPSLVSRLPLAALLAGLCWAPADAFAEASWAFAPGAYTHSPETGQRVVQYAQHEPVEGLPDPRQTVSRYWRTRTNLPGVNGSSDTIYEVRSFGNTLGGFDAQRERGHDAQLETLDALTPFRNNPFLFFGGMQGFGYGYPGYPAAPPGTPVPSQSGSGQNNWQNYGPSYAPQGAWQQGYGPQGYAPQGNWQQGYAPQGDWGPPMAQPQSQAQPQPGMPGTAWPYAPQSGFVAPMPFAVPFPYWGGGGWGGGGWNGGGWGGGGQHPGWRPQPWSGYGPGRQSHFQGGGW